MKALLLFFTFVSLTFAITCDGDNRCPKETPCCSQYGICGVGSYCLNGCNPRWSYNVTACMPAPVCKSSYTSFNSTKQFKSVNKYLGDADSTDWIYDGTILEYDSSIILAMPANSSGTVVSYSHYVWFGRIDVRMKTSHLAGVITAFILFSDVQDEVDYENVGVDLFKMQTNYYYQGIITLNHSTNITIEKNTFENYHTLSLDWKEDELVWLVDNVPGRTLKRNDTWNATSQKYDFPQTPSRVQISLWPGGASSSEGTIEWAGGAIDWNAPDIKNPGYYYAFIDSANVTCYDPPSGTKITGNMSYVYSDENGNMSDIIITDLNTTLNSLEATGLDPKKNATNSTGNDTIPSHGISSGGHPGGDGNDDGQANSGDDSSESTYTGSAFVQFAKSSDTTTSKSSAVSFTVDFRKLFTLLAVSGSMVLLFVIC